MEARSTKLLPGSFIIRVHYGDEPEYTYVCTAQPSSVKPQEVEIMGVLRSPTVEEWKAIKLLLRKEGFEWVRVKRKRKGEETRTNRHRTGSTSPKV
jgi:hypothetical protein